MTFHPYGPPEEPEDDEPGLEDTVADLRDDVFDLIEKDEAQRVEAPREVTA